MRQKLHAPLDPECPEVREREESLAGDVLMEMSGCRDEFDADFERRHRAKCKRCQEYGLENIEVV